MRKAKLILLILCAIVFSLSLQAKSTFGGIIFLDYYNFYKNAANVNGGLAGGQLPEKGSLTFSRLEVPTTTRLRGRWTNEDNVTMYIELGVGGGSGGTDARLRHAWGTWDFSETWQIMAGHSSTPYSPIFPSQLIGNSSGEDHIIGHGYGDHNPGRTPQIRFTYKFLNQRGALAVALVEPNGGDELTLDSAPDPIGDRNTPLPRLDVGVAYRTFNMQFFPGFFYQTQTYKNVPGGGNEDDVTSWGASLAFNSGFGAFLLSGEANLGQNWGNSRGSNGTSPAARNAGAQVRLANSRIEVDDADNQAYWLDLGYKFSTRATQGVVHLILGTMISEIDGFGGSEYESSMAGISVPIDLPWIAKGFRVRPEVFLYDEGNNTVNGVAIDFGTELIAGVQIQYTF